MKSLTRSAEASAPLQPVARAVVASWLLLGTLGGLAGCASGIPAAERAALAAGLSLPPPPPPLQPTLAASRDVLQCAELLLPVSVQHSVARLSFAEQEQELLATTAASGSLYVSTLPAPAGASSPDYVWFKGPRATVQWQGQRLPECTVVPTAAAQYRAVGQEPAWNLTISAMGWTLQRLGGESTSFMPQGAPQWGGGGASQTRLHALNPPGATVRITERLCADTMTGMPYPQTVEVVPAPGAPALRGCGGQPATLLQDLEWRVVGVRPSGVSPEVWLQDPPVTVLMDSQGALTGRAPCNRYAGSYKLTGEGLQVQQPALTRMACAPHRMAMEGDFMAVLNAVYRFERPNAHEIVFHAPDGGRIVARRPQ